MRPLIKIIYFILILSIFFLSCENPEQLEDKNIVTTELSSLTAPRYDQALVTFLSGDVEVLSNENWEPVYIGGFIEVGDTIKVYENSFCELQFGETAVIKIQENSEVKMDTVLFEPEQTDIALNIITGSFLFKVDKLIGNDQFNVKTNSAVCGVRGTEFMIKEDESGTILAVKEGEVAVLPASVDVNNLINKIEAEKLSAESAAEINKIINKIQENASIVSGNEEVFITDSLFSEDVTVSFNSVEELVDEIIQSEKLEAEGIITPEYKENLGTMVDTVIENVSIKNTQTEVSAENREILNQIDDMKIIEIKYQSSEIISEQSGEVEPEEVDELVKIAVNVEPETSVIELNGMLVGNGNYSGIFNSGEVLNFMFTNDGYIEKVFSINVEQGFDSEYDISLELEVQELIVTSAENTANEESNLTDPLTEELQTALNIEDPETLNPDEKVDSTINSTVANTEPDVTDKANTEPGNESFATETKITTAETQQASASDNIASSVNSNEPIVMKISISSTNLVGNISVLNDRAIMADRRGIVSGLDLSTGNVLYQISTANNPNENSFPIVIGNKLYFTGNIEFIIANAGNGNVINKISLDSNTSHAYGQRIAKLSNDRGLFPAHDSINVIGLSDGNILREINIPNSISMTPIVYEGLIYIVNQNGVLLIIEPESGNVVTTVPTRVNMPVGISVTIQNNRALFAGRMGNIVCYDIGAGSIAWEKELIRGSSMYVFQDIETSGRGVFIFSKGTLFGLSLRNGTEMFDPISGVSSPPLHYDGQIFFGSNSGQLVIANAGNGAILKSLYLGEKITTRPVVYNGYIVVGTEGGNIVIIDPGNM